MILSRLSYYDSLVTIIFRCQRPLLNSIGITTIADGWVKLVQKNYWKFYPLAYFDHSWAIQTGRDLSNSTVWCLKAHTDLWNWTELSLCNSQWVQNCFSSVSVMWMGLGVTRQCNVCDSQHCNTCASYHDTCRKLYRWLNKSGCCKNAAWPDIVFICIINAEVD